MSLNLFLPDLTGSSSKDLVIQVLAEEWPLSAKEVFNRVVRLSKSALTYQAVHKTLGVLEKEKIVLKKDGKYGINLDWANSVEQFATFLKKNLKSEKEVFPLTRKMIFSTVYEVDQFLSEFGKALKPTKEDVFALQWHHLWIPLFFSKDTYREMKELILSSNFYCVSPSDTPIDRWCESFWNNLGVKEKIGVKRTFGIDMLVFKDVIVQVFYPAEIKKAIDDVYSSTKDPSKLNVDNFFKAVFEKKTKIPVLITKNEEVASELLAQTKAFFG